MNQSGATEGAQDETHVDIEVLRQMDDSGAEDVSTLVPAVRRQPTGDQAVDQVLGELDAVTDEPLDTQIEVGEQVHRVLLGRLADLGKE